MSNVRKLRAIRNWTVSLRLLPLDRAQILSILVEGSSVRATSRMVGVAINTVQKLILDTGEAAAAFQDVQMTEIAALPDVGPTAE